MYIEKTIISDSVDGLAKQGVEYIESNGRKIHPHSGDATQVNNVNYVLTNCRNRVHTLRMDRSARYFARELLSYFDGSLDVNSERGLGNASVYWKKIADINGMINSNYGYYVFHMKTPEGLTQLDWVRAKFRKNIDTRTALININGIQHKLIATDDFPCTIGMLFSRDGNEINCDVQSRSTDIITGLPYDMGFFSLVTELVAGLVSVDMDRQMKPGYVAMHSHFTQIYDKSSKYLTAIKEREPDTVLQKMPEIDNPLDFLSDIYNVKDFYPNEKEKPKTRTMKWCVDNARKK